MADQPSLSRAGAARGTQLGSATSALDEAAADEIARRRGKRLRQLTTGIALTVMPTLIANVFFEIAAVPPPRHGGAAVRAVCGVTALLAAIVGVVIALRATVDLLRARQIRRILEATSWIECPARSGEARSRSVEVLVRKTYMELDVVGSSKRLAAQVRRSRRIEIARLLPAGEDLVARAVGSSDLFLAEDEGASSESTRGHFGDFVVALTLRGTRRVTHRSRSVTRLWGRALTFAALVTIGIALAAAAVSIYPVATKAPETWARVRPTYDVLKIICVITALGALWPLVGLARATYCESRGARRDRGVRAWIRMLLGWWAAMLSTAAIFALPESRSRAGRPSPALGIVTAAFAIVLAVLALRGPRETTPAEPAPSRPVVG